MANTSTTPFLAFTSDPKDIDTLKRFAVTHGWAESCVLQGDIRTATAHLKDNGSPALLLAEIPSAAEAQALLDGLAEVCSPHTKVIITGTVNEYSFFRWLMEIGISDYLLKPLTEQTLENAYVKSTAQPGAAAVAVKPQGKVVAVMGTRGGIGNTALAINLAGIFADAKKHTALVDLDPHDGSLAVLLDMEPSKGFREALEKPDRMDSLFLERVMQKHGPHLSILSSEETMQDRVIIHDSAADALLKELKEQYQIIVLDMPHYLNAFSRKCLSKADHVVLVTELTLVSLRDTLRISDMMRDGYKLKPPIVAINRFGMAPKHAIKETDFEKGTGAKIAYKIPYAPDVFMPVGTDIAAVKSKNHPAVKPLYQLASQIVPEVKAVADSGKAAKGGFFKRTPKEPKPPKEK